MISIIVCSRTAKVSESFEQNIAKNVGVEFEIVCIDNSKNDHSIYSAYNKGIQKSKYDNLCLVHEDVKFNTKGFGKKIIQHVNRPNVGLCGLAGCDILSRIPSIWGSKDFYANIIESTVDNTIPSKLFYEPQNYNLAFRPVLLLDGVILCAKKSVFEKIRFDENLGRFHGYDYDISIQSFVAGYTNIVMYDIELEHFSSGTMNIDYLQTIERIYKKWEKHIPLFERKISEDEKKSALSKVETKRLDKLFKTYIRCNADYSIIREKISYYSQLAGVRAIYKYDFMIFLSWIFNKTISRLRNKMIK